MHYFISFNKKIFSYDKIVDQIIGILKNKRKREKKSFLTMNEMMHLVSKSVAIACTYSY